MVVKNVKYIHFANETYSMMNRDLIDRSPVQQRCQKLRNCALLITYCVMFQEIIYNNSYLSPRTIHNKIWQAI